MVQGVSTYQCVTAHGVMSKVSFGLSKLAGLDFCPKIASTGISK